jgi:hypothetical protein
MLRTLVPPFLVPRFAFQIAAWAIIANGILQQSLFVPKGHLPPDGANLNVVPRRGMHLPEDTNPPSRGVASGNPEEEEVRGTNSPTILTFATVS